jgi:hypothetical protein
MRYFQLFEQFINEGGWSTQKTQETTITPDVIASVVKIFDKISTGFNKHIEQLELPSLDFLKPIGSGSWWEEDVKDYPDKTYGDVDYMIAYPTLDLSSKGERDNEIATVKLYNKELMSWLESEKIQGIDLEESRAISSDASLKLVAVVDLKNGNTGYVQVDMVVTHKQYQEWAVFRMTPIRNVKGFVLGNLYTAFGEMLDLSIQARGVRAKFEGEVMAPYSKRAGVEDRAISTNSETFMTDIVKFFWEQSGTDMPFNGTKISTWSGMDPKSPKFEDLCQGIILASETLEQLGEFGTTIKYKNSRQLIDAVISRYEEKMMTAYNSSKFDKASTPAAIESVKKIRETVVKYIELAKQQLK